MSVRVRFAPSPTGLLHVGNVRTALFNWLFARQDQGAFILRIEDTDAERSEKRFEDELQRDLRWLGLDWDEGIGAGGRHGPYRQTERFELYRQVARRLQDAGRAYPCFCSKEMLEKARREQLAAGESPRYPGTCRSLDAAESAARVSAGERAVLRFRVEEETVSFSDLVFGDLSVESREVGDFILLRADGSPQYNFAVVVDDLGMEVTHVIRGEGHLSNTPRQILLYRALGKSAPRFAHLSTILGADGAKLSKRHGATSLREFRRRGYLPEAMVNYLALLGWTPQQEGLEILSRDELVAEFQLGRVKRAPAIFDVEKLNWINRHYLGLLEPARLVSLVLPHLSRRGWVKASPSPPALAWLEKLAAGLRRYLSKGEDILEAAAVIFDFESQLALNCEQVMALDAASAAQVMRALERLAGATDEWNEVAVGDLLGRVKEETGARGQALFHPLRLALTGADSGPDLKTLIPLISEGSRLDLGRPIPGIEERIRRVRSLL